MSIVSLSKGSNVSLTKQEPGLKKVLVGLAWEERATAGQDFDLDASVFLLDSQGKVRNEKDFIFYNNLISIDGSVQHTGDERSGNTMSTVDNDCEQVVVNLATLPLEIDRLVFTVTIHNAEQFRQNFGQVSNCYIRILNEETGREITRYNLAEDSSTETAMEFGELYRYNGEWKFRAIGQGYTGGLMTMCSRYGIQASA